MLAGCAGGLLQDAWFEPGLVGASGFSKTFLGWALGALGSRFDLNAFWARSITGAALPAAESLVESGLRSLFDQAVVPWSGADLALRATVGGLLVPVVFAILDRARDGRPGSPARRRRS
jgi:cell shape-determining protein MreD